MECRKRTRWESVTSGGVRTIPDPGLASPAEIKGTAEPRQLRPECHDPLPRGQAGIHVPASVAGKSEKPKKTLKIRD
jgi:hypothetical protein